MFMAAQRSRGTPRRALSSLFTMIDDLRRRDRTARPAFLSLALHPLESVSEFAFDALFVDKDERLRWIAGQLAVNLCIVHHGEFTDAGWDREPNQRARAESLSAALAALEKNDIRPMPTLPPAWVKSAHAAEEGCRTSGSIQTCSSMLKQLRNSSTKCLSKRGWARTPTALCSSHSCSVSSVGQPKASCLRGRRRTTDGGKTAEQIC